MASALTALHDCRQPAWLDYIPRSLLTSGAKALYEALVSGARRGGGV